MLVCPHFSDMRWSILNQFNLTNIDYIPGTVLDAGETVPDKADITPVPGGQQIMMNTQGQKENVAG